MNKTPQLHNFNEIKDTYLKAYNRLVVAFNLNEQGKAGEAEAYLSQFSQKDKISIAVVTTDIKTRGLEAVRKAINFNVEPEGFYEETGEVVA